MRRTPAAIKFESWAQLGHKIRYFLPMKTETEGTTPLESVRLWGEWWDSNPPPNLRVTAGLDHADQLAKESGSLRPSLYRACNSVQNRPWPPFFQQLTSHHSPTLRPVASKTQLTILLRRSTALLCDSGTSWT